MSIGDTEPDDLFVPSARDNSWFIAELFDIGSIVSIRDFRSECGDGSDRVLGGELSFTELLRL